MSKTRKTRPYWVKLLDKPTYLEPFHRHEGDEPCDLPEVPVYRPEERTRCEWAPSLKSYFDPENWCGCAMCTAQQERKQKARKERRKGRKYTRSEWLKEY